MSTGARRPPARWLAFGLLGVFVAVGLVAAVPVPGSFVVAVGDAPGDVPPAASFAFDHEERQITHERGESVVADRLTVEVNGDETGTWAALTGSDSVDPGDGLVVRDLTHGDELIVRWHGDSRSVELGTFRYGEIE